MTLAIAFLALIIGTGAGIALGMRIAHHGRRAPDLARTRWEVVRDGEKTARLKALRDANPASHINMDVPFLGIVQPTGPQRDRIAQHCRDWSIDVVTTDKRTGIITGVRIASDDPDAAIKRTILHRAGLRPDALEQMQERMPQAA